MRRGRVSRPRASLEHLYTFGKLSFFDCGGTRLFLEENAEPASESVLYLRVPDINVAYQELQARGISYASAPHLIHRHADGMEEWMAFFEDLERRTLAIMCQVKPVAPEVAGASLDLGLPNTTDNGFDVVAIRIQDEGSVVGGSVTRTGTRLAIVRSTSIERSAMERFDRLLAVSLECKMNPGSPIGSTKVECWRTSLLEANVDVGAPT